MTLFRVIVVPENVELLPFIQRRVFELFAIDNRLFSITQVARLTGRSRKRVRSVLKKMVRAGYIVEECDI